jgi:hypothetical protein
MFAVLKVAVAKPAATLATITTQGKNLCRRSRNAATPSTAAVTTATGSPTPASARTHSRNLSNARGQTLNPAAKPPASVLPPGGHVPAIPCRLGVLPRSAIQPCPTLYLRRRCYLGQWPQKANEYGIPRKPQLSSRPHALIPRGLMAVGRIQCAAFPRRPPAIRKELAQ